MSTRAKPTQPHTADPYVVLGVPRNASRRQIAQAYKRLAKRHHPDVDPDPASAERMRCINTAWRTLSDASSRANHDAEANPSSHWSDPHRYRRPRTRPTGSWTAWGPRPGYYHDAQPRPRRRPAPSAPRISARRPDPADVRFQDTGWAALLAVGVMLVVLFAAAYAGSLPSSSHIA